MAKSHLFHWIAAPVCLTLASISVIAPAKQTICAITINSSDEREAFRRHLPAREFDVIELVESGRTDWFERACHAGVRCDALVISGHHDGNSFFSEQLDAQAFLALEELERAACSQRCPDLLGALKEVYLFGCNTLNPLPQHGAAAVVARFLSARPAIAPTALPREPSRRAAIAQAEASRDVMRQVFKDVPAIYGFASAAPVGQVAGGLLANYLRTTGKNEVGRGRISAALLNQFAGQRMTAASGAALSRASSPEPSYVCQFADQRRSVSERLEFVHDLLRDATAEAAMHLDRITALIDALDPPERRATELIATLRGIHDDADAREHFLRFVRAAPPSELRVRMIGLAGQLGWLADGDAQFELTRLIDELLADKKVGLAEINVACAINRTGSLDTLFAGRALPAGADPARAALQACLGSDTARAAALQTLLGARASDHELSQALLRHRPIVEISELRRFVAAIAQSPAAPLQVNALQSIAGQVTPDPLVVDTLLRLFTDTESPAVQAAIASIFLRLDRHAIARDDLEQVLAEHRRTPAGTDLIVDTMIQSLMH